MAIDIVTPTSSSEGGGGNKGFDPTQPFLLLLAGLTGGSNERYLSDMTNEALKR